MAWLPAHFFYPSSSFFSVAHPFGGKVRSSFGHATPNQTADWGKGEQERKRLQDESQEGKSELRFLRNLILESDVERVWDSERRGEERLAKSSAMPEMRFYLPKGKKTLTLAEQLQKGGLLMYWPLWWHLPLNRVREPPSLLISSRVDREARVWREGKGTRDFRVLTPFDLMVCLCSDRHSLQWWNSYQAWVHQPTLHFFIHLLLLWKSETRIGVASGTSVQFS